MVLAEAQENLQLDKASQMPGPIVKGHVSTPAPLMGSLILFKIVTLPWQGLFPPAPTTTLCPSQLSI